MMIVKIIKQNNQFIAIYQFKIFKMDYFSHFARNISIAFLCVIIYVNQLKIPQFAIENIYLYASFLGENILCKFSYFTKNLVSILHVFF